MMKNGGIGEACQLYVKKQMGIILGFELASRPLLYQCMQHVHVAQRGYYINQKHNAIQADRALPQSSMYHFLG